MSFHNFKPGLEQTDPPEPTTKVWGVNLKQVIEWDFKVRAESEQEAIDKAYSAREYGNPHSTGDCEAYASDYPDNGQEVDLE